MIHVGIDHHKKFDHAVALDDAGKIVWDGRLRGDEASWRELKAALPEGEPLQSVLEAGWNWGILFDRLAGDLALMDILQKHIRETEHWIDDVLKDHPLVDILQSLPGIGKIFAALIALEIDTMDRFVSAGKFCSYSGLVNSTYSSGGKTFHGGLIPTCNHRLRYAFIEAAWTASRISPYS